MKTKYIIILCALSLVIGFLLFKPITGAFTGEEEVIRIDTTEVITEHKIESPLFSDEFVSGHITATVPLLNVDSIKTDSIKLKLPRTTRVYQDSNYRAVVSGYNPTLDSLIFYSKNTYTNYVIPNPKKEKPRWSVGVQVGYGTDFQGFSPYIGIGIQYNIFSW